MGLPCTRIGSARPPWHGLRYPVQVVRQPERSRQMTVEPLIVAVDDEPGILRLIKLELSSQGFRVVTAGNGEDALAIVEHQRPDVVVLDIIMPDMSGLEVMRRIRE